MKFNLLKKILVVLIIIAPLLTDQGCKKQPRCGCGKDVIFSLDSALVSVTYDTVARSATFYPFSNSAGATYYFCNPGEWFSTLKKINTQNYVLLSGKVYYECNFLYNSSNYYYQIPPVYQVTVTAVMEDNYGKK
jgi:hypothetical protein